MNNKKYNTLEVIIVYASITMIIIPIIWLSIPFSWKFLSTFTVALLPPSVAFVIVMLIRRRSERVNPVLRWLMALLLAAILMIIFLVVDLQILAFLGMYILLMMMPRG